MTENDVIGFNRISMSSGIRGKKNFVDRLYGSKVISIIKVKLWTGGGARGNELETPKLVQLLLGLSSIRMSNQNNFPANGSMGCHRRPVGRRRIKRTGTETIGNIAASSHYRGQAQEAATDANMGGSGRPTAARSN